MENMETKHKIALVDDNVTNLMAGKSALVDAYEVYTVPSGKAFFELLEHVRPDLILLDIAMPEMDGYEVIKQFKADPKNADIPVIFLTALNDTGSELEGLSLGAVDYITKPFSPPRLRKRVEIHLLIQAQRRQLAEYNFSLEQMVARKTETIIALQKAVVDLLTVVVEYRDDETGGHIHRTRRYIAIMLDEMKRSGIYQNEITSWDQTILVLSSALHDVGKLAIPDSILLKPGPLSDTEREIMRKHSAYGGEIIMRVEDGTLERAFIRHAKLMATTHHEKWDGTGYPQGLAGKDIPLQGRLMALADVYDALIFKRPYKPALTHETAVDIICRSSGSAFEPALVEVFLRVADKLRAASMDE